MVVVEADIDHAARVKMPGSHKYTKDTPVCSQLIESRRKLIKGAHPISGSLEFWRDPFSK